VVERYTTLLNLRLKSKAANHLIIMELINSDSLTFNYSDIFFSYLHNDERQCTQMAKNHVLLYVYSGEFIVEEGKKKTIISKGESVFIRRDNRVIMTKQPSMDEPFKGIFLIFKRQFLRDFFQTVNKKNVPSERLKKMSNVVSIENNANVDSLFHSMLPYFNKTTIPPQELMELKLQEGVLSLLNMDKNFYQYLFDFSEPWKIDIIEFLEQNFTYELSIEEIAAFTGRSLATFKRDFKKVSALPPQQWLIQRRLKAAYEKLKFEGKRVKDVYFEVGFKNQSHFSLAFKKQYGFSPGR
jgi:AraC-like DNA-binding protein